MSATLVHRGVAIVSLAPHQEVRDHCRPGQSAICERADGWWLYFVDEDGAVDGYDSPFASYTEALWAAKAAAEFSAE